MQTDIWEFLAYSTGSVLRKKYPCGNLTHNGSVWGLNGFPVDLCLAYVANIIEEEPGDKGTKDRNVSRKYVGRTGDTNIRKISDVGVRKILGFSQTRTSQ